MTARNEMPCSGPKETAHLEVLAPRTRKVAAAFLWEARRLTNGERRAKTAAWALARTAEALKE